MPVVVASVEVELLFAIESDEFIGIALGSVVVGLAVDGSVEVGLAVDGSVEVDGLVGTVPGDVEVPGDVGEPGVVVCASAAVERPRAATPSMVTIRMEDVLLLIVTVKRVGKETHRSHIRRSFRRRSRTI